MREAIPARAKRRPERGPLLPRSDAPEPALCPCRMNLTMRFWTLLARRYRPRDAQNRFPAAKSVPDRQNRCPTKGGFISVRLAEVFVPRRLFAGGQASYSRLMTRKFPGDCAPRIISRRPIHMSPLRVSRSAEFAAIHRRAARPRLPYPSALAHRVRSRTPVCRLPPASCLPPAFFPAVWCYRPKASHPRPPGRGVPRRGASVRPPGH